MKSRISLLLSTYHSDRFLEAWIDSVCQQTRWSDIEILIVANEPSPDERKILEIFAATHPRQVWLDVVKRETLYKSWNRCLARSTAPLVGIANVDDLRFPDSLDRQIDAMETHPDALFCYGPFYTSQVFPPPRQPPARDLVEAAEFDREEFTRSMCLGPFFVWRKTNDPAVQWFDEQFKSGGDFDFAVRLALRGAGLRIPAPLGIYHHSGQGLSTGTAWQAIERTVIELRYGIYDKLNYAFLARATSYTIPQILSGGAWIPIEELVPDYPSWLERRRERWLVPGLMRPTRVLLSRAVQAIKKTLEDLYRWLRQ